EEGEHLLLPLSVLPLQRADRLDPLPYPAKTLRVEGDPLLVRAEAAGEVRRPGRSRRPPGAPRRHGRGRRPRRRRRPPRPEPRRPPRAAARRGKAETPP